MAIEARLKVERESVQLASITRYQELHFLKWDLGLSVLTLTSFFFIRYESLGVVDALVFLLLAYLSALGIEVGYHRLFTHRSFEASPLLQWILGVCAGFSAQGPLFSWVVTHRYHHKHSDKEQDVHSPWGEGGARRGFWHAHLLWKRQYQFPKMTLFGADLLKEPRLKRINRLYPYFPLVGWLLPALLCGVASAYFAGHTDGFLNGLLISGIIRTTISQHATWCINSVCHLWGSRDFETSDQSRNVWWLALPTLGSSWHNNHHAKPAEANFSNRWQQIDLGYWSIRCFAWCGLASLDRRRNETANRG